MIILQTKINFIIKNKQKFVIFKKKLYFCTKINKLFQAFFMSTNYFNIILEKYREESLSQRQKGNKFEQLIKNYLQTDPLYANQFEKIWLWNEFPARTELGGVDTGIDLVAQLYNGDYWAIQCKFFAEGTTIDKPAIDSFLATSGREFIDANLQRNKFVTRLWVDTTGKEFGKNAEEVVKNLTIPFQRISLYQLINAPIDWEKLDKGMKGEEARITKKILFEHQNFALQKTNEYLKTNDRGKLIMACGTGKTFTSLKIAENETNKKGLILFLVPSIALLGQTLREWSAESETKINAICICSDANVSTKKNQNDEGDISTIDLALPASTKIDTILRQFEFIKKINKNEGMTVVFSTYQSIHVIAEAQKELLKQNKNFGVFDLIICDEAHRTSGIKLANEDESAFIKVHDNNFLKAKKRIYMTATPKLYGDSAKSKANRYDAVLCSMDDETIYGKEMYRIGFGEAVERGLLTEYKVLILTLNENEIPQKVQEMIANENNEIDTEITAKLIGCINAFSKQVIGDDGTIANSDPQPMKTAVAFASRIKDSKNVTKLFNDLKNVYYEEVTTEKKEKLVNVNAQHVDGQMQINEREQKLQWLKKPADNECRILTNARCLSEGIDVPALDAVIFLASRDSHIDVVQSVGRVMRKAPNKKYGYIIIPIVIPFDIAPDQALDDNKRYKIVWDVLNALRAHDETFNTTINQIELNEKKPSKIHVVETNTEGNKKPDEEATKKLKDQLAIHFKELQKYIFAKIVTKVGDRRYWEQWAKDVAIIAEKYIEKITHFINTKEIQKNAFHQFLGGLRKNINPAISQTEAIEMLAQHLITKPVFDALFQEYSFVKNNPVSTSMQKMIETLENQTLEKDTEILQKFYDSVKKRAEGIDNAKGKQKIIIELYDKFFKNAFPKMVEKLGIVYTPTEVVDFIIHSVENILQTEFNRSITDQNIHILDPFAGTGTFMVRLLQSGLIKQQDLHRKFKNELHANEIVLLAYYIAAINMETTFFDLNNQKEYAPFEGIVLTDTFQLSEKETNQLFPDYLQENNAKIQAQKNAPLRIIIGNPPYSVGQKSANDNAQNQKYEQLDSRIDQTYANASNSGLNKSNYDSYIKAFRWASDRLDQENGGIIAFVTNGAWLDSNSADGFRKTITKEFSSIYVFNLRGNQRTSGELSRKEGGKIFGSGSRTPVSLTFLVKNPHKNTEKTQIFYYDIGDYHNREQKLKILEDQKSIKNLALQTLEPNEKGDWIAKRNEGFETFLPLAPEKKLDKKSNAFFNTYAIGMVSNRDAWVYNFSKNNLENNMKRMIDFYNEQQKTFANAKKENKNIEVQNLIDTNPIKISWTVNLKNDIHRNKNHSFDSKYIIAGHYRPFCKQNLYFDNPFIERPGIHRQLFPNTTLENQLICVSGLGNTKDFSVLISNIIPDLGIVSVSQCFPLYYYEEVKKEQHNIFDKNMKEYVRRDGISDFVLGQARGTYGNLVQKEDIFYYVYGFLHSPHYKETFANDLKKMLPRLPLVEDGKDFWAFSQAGKQLAKLHLEYEHHPKPKELVLYIKEGLLVDYKVYKMRFAKKDKETDKSIIDYNSQISIQNIPLRAYEYVVNGKSAIEWIMERYQITQHKESKIDNNPNDWASECENPKYIFDLLLSVIHLSLASLDIIEKLPQVSLE